MRAGAVPGPAGRPEQGNGVAFDGIRIKSALAEVLTIEGVVGAAVGDICNGLTLATVGTGLDLELAVAGMTQVLRAQRKTLGQLGLSERVDHALVTGDQHLHVVRMLAGEPDLFLYVVMKRRGSNLGDAWMQLARIEHSMA